MCKQHLGEYEYLPVAPLKKRKKDATAKNGPVECAGLKCKTGQVCRDLMCADPGAKQNAAIAGAAIVAGAGYGAADVAGAAGDGPAVAGDGPAGDGPGSRSNLGS